jgi:hypothetical protein
MTNTAAGHALSIPEVYDWIDLVLGRLNAELRSRNIDYVVIGGVALVKHGYRRYTDNLDVVLTKDGFERFRKELLGRGGWGLAGYDAVPGDLKTVRSYPEGLVINLKLSGDFPGDGKPNPVPFPTPSVSGQKTDGINFTTLENLIELKLTSGLTRPDRLKDLADIQEMIKVRKLTRDFAAKLHPYVREKYLELVDAVEQGKGNAFEEQS